MGTYVELALQQRPPACLRACISKCTRLRCAMANVPLLHLHLQRAEALGIAKEFQLWGRVRGR